MRLLDPEKLNYELAAVALRWIAAQPNGGAVLVFMPGVLAPSLQDIHDPLSDSSMP